jgi:hypothetical protein
LQKVHFNCRLSNALFHPRNGCHGIQNKWCKGFAHGASTRETAFDIVEGSPAESH